jgi:hypothetical protein
LEELISKERTAWVDANRFGPTATSWEKHEAYIRSKYAELSAMPEEQRDVALVEGHLEKVGMLEAVLKHIDSLLPIARAKEAAEMRNRSVRRKRKKKGQGARGKRR